MPLINTSPVQDFNSRFVIYFLLLVTAVVWVIHRRQKKLRMYRLGNLIPGPMALPLFGNALLALGKRPEHADDIEVILNSHIHIDKASEYRFFKPWLGEGLLISSGEKWRSHRKMIAPTFHINILKSFMDVFNQNSRNVVEKMRPEIGKTFDVHEYMSGVTVDILLETAMGITRETQDASGFDYAMAVMKMCDIIHQRHYKFWLRFDAIFQITSFFKKQIKLLQVIKSKKEAYFKNKAEGFIPPTIEELTIRTYQNDNVLANDSKTVSDTVFKGYRDDLDFNDENDIGMKKRLAFLDLMIESAQNGTNNISDQEIKEEVDTIMFEGHDTTAAGSSFVLCLLGVHQDIQSRVYDELYGIFGDSDRSVTFEDTLQMKYLERVILESLRMYPPVPIIARKLNRDVKIGNTLRNCRTLAVIVINISLVKHYKNPDVFDPDNFLPENMANRHYYSFIPFSAGPRSCVVLRSYRSISEIKEDQFQLQADIILKRTDGFQIKLEPRNRVPSSS
ncbi:Cytochrome P450 4G49 [Operophtera brumata]|uniref:Cytochrome P450 4G49 n=1 Tax=Operophtera brumata TaxID=104452 RepID=A0A0L7L7K6_OPEBR|nr:Cytochrome P450 4G49 [Operophtera brumata]